MKVWRLSIGSTIVDQASTSSLILLYSIGIASSPCLCESRRRQARSLDRFSFGQNNTQQQPPAIPSLSVTGATPSAQPAAPFSFGTQPAQNAGTSAPPGTAAGTSGGASLFGNFGATQQQPQQQQQPAAGTSSLFGNLGQNNQNPQPQQGGATNPPAGGSLFGGGGLFGNKSTTAPGATGTSTGFGTSSLFGNQNQQQQQQPAPSTSLFGSTNNQQPAQQNSSLFGSTNNNQQGGSLFAPSTVQGNQACLLLGDPSRQINNGQSTGTLFGQMGQSQNQPSMFGQPNQQNLQQSQQGGSGGITGSTKFTDLPEQHQKMIEEFE